MICKTYSGGLSVAQLNHTQVGVISSAFIRTFIVLYQDTLGISAYALLQLKYAQSTHENSQIEILWLVKFLQLPLLSN